MRFKLVFSLTLGCIVLLSGLAMANDIIKIGYNIPITGDIPKVGESSKFAAEMLKEEMNNKGGLEVGGKKYELEFIYGDNEANEHSAVMTAVKLIEVDGVLAMIGPNSSTQAIPAAQVAEELSTVMISPWSTNPATTLNRPWVFRAGFIDNFQGPVAVNFAIKEFDADKAAVLYDIESEYSKGLAEIFKEVFEEKKGDQSVVAFESHGAKDIDFTSQLIRIVEKKPDFLFIPDSYNQAALIVKQARAKGYAGQIMGADAWGTSELMSLCGDDCKGSYFSTHYAAEGATGETKEFIDRYQEKYGYIPDDVAALNWDSLRIVLQAIQNTGGLSGNLREDRMAVRKNLESMRIFEGVTGKMQFDVQGDPVKCAMVVKISESGSFKFVESVCPEE